ncbi:hypothetical protein ACHHYP_07613 [Achlya hypogyna]|uniref:Uncharacterized protein n=1 Tax=Achlya hypogyna TaxID=1202772 RepID=A0A1V9ZLN5_ACHHY|nr:hypothetical protein ACHHYP_07613 [Achlya hypogyna]
MDGMEIDSMELLRLRAAQLNTSLTAVKPDTERLTYAEIFELFHATDYASSERLLDEYECVNALVQSRDYSGTPNDTGDEEEPRTPSSLDQSANAQARKTTDKNSKRPHSQITDDGPRAHSRGRPPANSGRQPKLKKSKLMQKLTGRKNGRPIV